MDFNYYKNEIDKLKNFTGISIQLVDYDGNKTRFFDLNIESITELNEFFNMLSKIQSTK
jgi:hypothetical protein